MRSAAIAKNGPAEDSTQVLIRIRIYTPYADLVRTNTEFWNAGGLSLKMGLFGMEVSTTSIESLVVGGVALATPGGDLAPAAADGAEFALQDAAPKDWLKWQPNIPIHPPESIPAAPVRDGGIPFLHEGYTH